MDKKVTKSDFSTKAFTLVELLVVMGLLAILSVSIGIGVKSQIAKGHDARRKADLLNIKVAMRSYYEDKGIYPPEDQVTCDSTFMAPYLDKIPCDPTSSGKYVYTYLNPDPNKYAVFTNLEQTSDPAIAGVGCIQGCGPSGANYYISSDNLSYSSSSGEEGVLPTCPSSNAPADQRYCFANVCSGCCPGAGFRCSRNGNRCLADPSCITPTPTLPPVID